MNSIQNNQKNKSIISTPKKTNTKIKKNYFLTTCCDSIIITNCKAHPFTPIFYIITMRIEQLSGKRVLGNACSKDYTNWAEGLLYEGVESENVAILAGMSFERNPDSEEIEAYFQKSLKDLNIQITSDDEALNCYAKYICTQIISGDVTPEHGLEILQNFYRKSDYEAIYSIWDDLVEDVWMTKNHEGCIFNTGLTRENIGLYITEVAKQFIVLLDTDIPENFFYLCSCSHCGHIGVSGLEKIEKSWMSDRLFRLIYQRHQARRIICANCRTPYPKNMSDFEGRIQYLISKH
ncbi:hypothetical protein OL229_08900 [Neisseriaceae bacterium JH1-16]|nr:hypothetical protein [Neisseriaceae bacterium JH1-16]